MELVRTYTIVDMGQRIRERRDELGMSRQKMSDIMHELGSQVNQKTIESWEVGRNYCSLKNIPFVCQVLDCDTEYLFGNSPTPHKATTDVSKATGLSKKAVERLMKGQNARENKIKLPLEEHLAGYFGWIKAINTLIETSAGNQFLVLLFDYIYGNLRSIELYSKTNEMSTINSLEAQLEGDSFELRIYDENSHSTRYYSEDEFKQLMRDSKFGELQKKIIQICAEVMEGEER